MLRGIDKRYIFEENEDREVFLRCLKRAKEKSKFQLFGYCLMDNHVHLLIKEGQESLGYSIKRITVGYVQWHNRKYGRTGHLFQNRYKSECVETDTYLLVVIRYIHQNPFKASLVTNLSEFPWSSYIQYLAEVPSIIDREMVLSYFGGISEFKDFMQKINSDKCMDDENKKLWTDKALRSEIEKICRLSQISEMDKQDRDNIISMIKKETKASNRQISRVIGIGRGIVERVQ